MFKIQEVRELIKLIDNSNIDEFEYTLDGATIRMKKQISTALTYEAPRSMIVEEKAAATESIPVSVPVSVPVQEAPKAATSEDNLHKITSPMVGTFYASPSPDASAYVKVGDRISADTVVCIVEAMKLFNEIEAEVEGEIVEILVKNGQLVEYGQPLFLVR
ncbi:acetyl-CoA carboxylase biotin carboxyl carrier protein [Ectobacillus antri]|jgi:acetyl-CoA carboxylase biotin carboxyl carrier protein|uniref:Biotin carboxyl carrier protein of acetyl-CoA carboxylase n=1 Tax=Ectobacillus antri TaxID=2486280 RepID=A0ABT6H4J6_9BACI|nr:acetyl-CoA carboxylase biotin carboxyl carrier protein [Ectobacillus antri]MDG4655598.1 acetyl-CoA carboxylase biotin carboxyl carrier protein [Ectobacillus antri]MDG5753356.1 acetyl-CoA carboxylase biotin carboxyl carrier protein [Ectobacillus antri]